MKIEEIIQGCKETEGVYSVGSYHYDYISAPGQYAAKGQDPSGRILLCWSFGNYHNPKVTPVHWNFNTNSWWIGDIELTDKMQKDANLHGIDLVDFFKDDPDSQDWGFCEKCDEYYFDFENCPCEPIK